MWQIAELREQLNITDIKLKRAETVHEKLKSCKAELLTKSKTIKDLEKQVSEICCLCIVPSLTYLANNDDFIICVTLNRRN